MRKPVSALTATAMAMVGIASMSSVPALSQSTNAATITKDVGCGAFVPNTGFALFTIEGHHRVVTSSGNVKLVCHFDIPEGQEPAKATRAEGFDCVADGQFTTDSQIVATPGGKATLTCSIKG